MLILLLMLMLGEDKMCDYCKQYNEEYQYLWKKFIKLQDELKSEKEKSSLYLNDYFKAIKRIEEMDNK